MEPEIWIGLECTLNRIGNGFIDQCALSGHWERPGDFALFGNLGARRIRYPFHWERFAPASLDSPDWSRAEAGLKGLQEVGLSPIAGFLHHGSGPIYTDLLDPAFPKKIAAFSKAFAKRFPWITDYTPINEPLTTARFSGLYGIWYPHARDNASFARILFHQIKGIILSMKEIRKIRPDAILIQTEDIGRASGSETLKYQVEFENERRWLTYELLLGRVGPGHPMHGFLLYCGLKEEELAELREEPCPPDLIGINHYPLSNRYLDHRLSLFPKESHGGNGKDKYADIGAVDFSEAPLPDTTSLYRKVWKRYGLPMAATEVHVRGHRETQVRWLQEIWRSAIALNAEGADFRAVTLWSLLGTYGWDSLCTTEAGYYEPGVFELRAPKPRPTALAKWAQEIGKNPSYVHPVAEDPVLWPNRPRSVAPLLGRKILITGGHGTLGRAFTRICEMRGLAACALERAALDITDPASVREALEEHKPWAVVNAAAFVKVDEAEVQQVRCFQENVNGAELLARECARRSLRFVSFSSDMVFDGATKNPYLESHPVAPLNFYGKSKAESEQRVLEACPEALVVRTSSFFGPWDSANFVTALLREIRNGNRFSAANDLTVSPTYVPDLVHHILDLLIDGESGLIHLANAGSVTWADLASSALHLARNQTGSRLRAELLQRRPHLELSLSAVRPRYSVLATERTHLMPTWENALERYFIDVETNRKIGEELAI